MPGNDLLYELYYASVKKGLQIQRNAQGCATFGHCRKAGTGTVTRQRNGDVKFPVWTRGNSLPSLTRVKLNIIARHVVLTCL